MNPDGSLRKGPSTRTWVGGRGLLGSRGPLGGKVALDVVEGQLLQN
jgi:hypothetical protein